MKRKEVFLSRRAEELKRDEMMRGEEDGKEDGVMKEHEERNKRNGMMRGKEYEWKKREMMKRKGNNKRGTWDDDEAEAGERIREKNTRGVCVKIVREKLKWH